MTTCIMQDGRVIIRPLQAGTRIGSVLLPEASELESGQVLAVCYGWYQDGIWVEPAVAIGDLVLFDRHMATPMRAGGEVVKIMHYCTIVAILVPDSIEPYFPPSEPDEEEEEHQDFLLGL